MFRPERLTRIVIKVPEEFISSVTAILARIKLLHLVRLEETPLGKLGYRGELDPDLFKEYEAIIHRLNILIKGLEIPMVPPPLREEVIPEREIFHLRECLQNIEKKASRIINKKIALRQRISDSQRLIEKLRLLPGDLEPEALEGLHYTGFALGLIPLAALAKLEEALSQIHHATFKLSTLQERAVVLVFGLKRDWPTFEAAFKGVFLEKIELLSSLKGKVTEILTKEEKKIQDLEVEREHLEKEIQDLRKRYGPELLSLREKALWGRTILSARRFFGKIEKIYVITGWIPKRLVEKVKKEILAITRNQAQIELLDPQEIREVRQGIIKIPVLFNNPYLIRPFERLVGLYGTPSYEEIEPTPFLAITFLLMFGMMFGDLGQGGILALLGYYIFRQVPRYLDYGIILMECGLSSMVFGLLYGSLFGLENIIPALWMQPLKDITSFLKASIFWGLIILSLGVVLNLINILRQKRYEALLSTGGLAGALFYWLAMGLLVRYFLSGQVSARELEFFAWTAAALVILMILHRPIYLLFRRKSPKRIFERGIFSYLVEATIEVFDGLLRYFTATVSFVRVAAFALTHAALFVAVFSLADLLARQGGQGLGYWLVVAVGNLFIILLEGLVVSIQVLRLEYYEFFSRFFHGGGEPFRPFTQDIKEIKAS
ncbi:hypothetical protein G4V39_00520 [Thermosulfuriphilus ammonigenes]|uniref:Uncharacterized protein n=1 Tax=Thermosulfuriphilus ammonigenes TaxID=1936021 RepID=A0A6G7PT67_9BACT|nr:V-type ATPase 116kDa subunit family protein [Thermosulfuriphilus ammonigenes]MBA2849227.1 V/A-type H+-transporting ATPase subunit I [Thermosulfuriphilus ammonigenes]QIJ70842.1 hypothetical protein G4V39_00520 [Thermosulfuriphilus ammonigenes]